MVIAQAIPTRIAIWVRAKSSLYGRSDILGQASDGFGFHGVGDDFGFNEAAFSAFEHLFFAAVRPTFGPATFHARKTTFTAEALERDGHDAHQATRLCGTGTAAILTAPENITTNTRRLGLAYILRRENRPRNDFPGQPFTSGPFHWTVLPGLPHLPPVR